MGKFNTLNMYACRFILAVSRGMYSFFSHELTGMNAAVMQAAPGINIISTNSGFLKYRHYHS